jgi:hypothetical protein
MLDEDRLIDPVQNPTTSRTPPGRTRNDLVLHGTRCDPRRIRARRTLRASLQGLCVGHRSNVRSLRRCLPFAYCLRLLVSEAGAK